jgi:hypothetical protein
MLQKLKDNFMKKSLKERFLLFIGILFFLIYLTFGMAFVFWDKLPLRMAFGYRLALGLVMIVYAFIRFLRFFNANSQQ